MKLSTKSRYGVRLLLDMAVHQDQAHVNLTDVACRQDISPKYLWQIIEELKRNNIVKSVRGAYGGYRLNAAPGSITLKDILTILEGDLFVVDEDPDFSVLERSLQNAVYDPLGDVLTETLQGISLQDLVDMSNVQSEQLMYYL